MNSKLSRQGFKRLIHTHVLSRMSYGSQLWGGCSPVKSMQRMWSLYYKFLRLLCKDFLKLFNNRELLIKSEMRSLDSLFTSQCCKTLHNVCYNLVPDQLAMSIFSRGYYNDRYPNRLFFPRCNSKVVGMNSFTNRLRSLEALQFEWLNKTAKEFNDEISISIPKF